MQFSITTLLALAATGFCAPSETKLDVGGCCVAMDGKILARCVGFDASNAATVSRRGDVEGCAIDNDGRVLASCVGFDASDSATVFRRGELVVRGCASVQAVAA